ncbi:MAG: hypothetical protein ACK5PF_03780 [bacterium]
MSDKISREDALRVTKDCPDSHWGPWIADRIRALPAVQPDAAAIQKTAWNIAVEMELDAAMSTKTAAKAGAIEAAIRALIDNTRKEVVPIVSDDPANQSDIGPGDQAVAGAAKFALDRIREWESDNLTDGTERDWHGHVGPALARLASTLVAQPKPVAGAAPRRASGPIDPDAGFATTGAEARWIGDVDAGVYDDTPEEIGILQARLEDQDRTIADLTRQLQGQPRRQSDVVAGAARYRTKPVVKEAIQWTGENLAEVLTFTGKHPKWDEWFSSFEHYEAHVRNDRQVFKIKTLEGTMEASPGDWIIRGLTVGQCYPCKPDIFAATYEPVPGAQTTICDDCGNASLAHSLAVWTEDGASYCPSCRPEIAASPIRKGEQP